MKASTLPTQELAERPEGYRGPNLSPRGLRLTPTQLATDTWALVANLPPKDNNGLVVGKRAALVVDAGIVPDVSAQLQQLVAQQTDRPLRYLVNTTYHGDHTFGNASFPAEVTVISSRINRDNMTDLAYEKARRAGNMYGDVALLDAVTAWRKPDVVFDAAAEIDLGGRAVQLLYFGPGNGPGDTIVYLPDAHVAWTGNYLSHAGIAPMLLQGGPTPYLASLRRMREALPELRTIVPGHGPVGDGHAAIDWLVGYLEQLLHDVAQARQAGRTMQQTLQTCPSPFADGLDPRVVSALTRYQLPQDVARQRLLELMRNLHRLNVLATYRALEWANRSLRGTSEALRGTK
jgi:cyclase